MARLQYGYEWDVELLNAAAEIEDHNFCASAAEMIKHAASVKHHQMVLVWSAGNNESGVVDRAWAYLTDGKLPEYFTKPDADGHYQPIGQRVPKRFHNELRKVQKGGINDQGSL